MVATMARTPSRVFESIESAHEYVGLLCDAIDEAEETIEHEMALPVTSHRHVDALRLAHYKLNSLRQHLLVSRRLLNDLRTLRRYLLEERTADRPAGRSGATDTALADAFV